ncbi:unnamed protein product [Protopolystoma xenopodis]|uniref:Uncharacterized protein n=1 Tax=Protopolystoma xenopodis TaxID=117903 RepID=A0A3S4ZMK4_9PLAT|nr:unnamed protein product [Protopolystoma xenopodis]
MRLRQRQRTGEKRLSLSGRPPHKSGLNEEVRLGRVRISLRQEPSSRPKSKGEEKPDMTYSSNYLHHHRPHRDTCLRVGNTSGLPSLSRFCLRVRLKEVYACTTASCGWRDWGETNDHTSVAQPNSPCAHTNLPLMAGARMQHAEERECLTHLAVLTNPTEKVGPSAQDTVSITNPHIYSAYMLLSSGGPGDLSLSPDVLIIDSNVDSMPEMDLGHKPGDPLTQCAPLNTNVAPSEFCQI